MIILDGLFLKFNKQAITKSNEPMTQEADQPIRRISIWKKILISIFITINILTTLFSNRPSELITWSKKYINENIEPQKAYRLFYAGWWIRQYAHIMGLDSRWEMFGKQSQFNWHFVIKADYGGDELITLPLPLQSKRTFSQAHFFDFRENKIHLNMYANSTLRAAYSSYLRRAYPQSNGAPLQAILWELHHQNILPRSMASELGMHLEEESYERLLDFYFFN